MLDLDVLVLLCSTVLVPQMMGGVVVAPVTENVSVKHRVDSVTSLAPVAIAGIPAIAAAGTPFSVNPTDAVLVDGPAITNVTKSKRN